MADFTCGFNSVRGRPHYYATKTQQYAVIRFNLNADFSSLFTWNTKQVFVYVSANWPNATSKGELVNEAVIWDTIITNPSADHLQNIGATAMKKLVRSAKGKPIDPSRCVTQNVKGDERCHDIFENRVELSILTS